MPVQTSDFDSIRESRRVGLPHFRSRSPEEYVHNNSANDVKSMQAREREVRGEEVVCTREMSHFKFMSVLKALHD